MSDITCANVLKQRSQNLKYFGITLDRTLTFNKQVEETVHMARQELPALKIISCPERTIFTRIEATVNSKIGCDLDLLTLVKYISCQAGPGTK